MRLCREFHCLPSQLEGEDATILRLLAIEAAAHPEPEPESEPVE